MKKVKKVNNPLNIPKTHKYGVDKRIIVKPKSLKLVLVSEFFIFNNSRTIFSKIIKTNDVVNEKTILFQIGSKYVYFICRKGKITNPTIVIKYNITKKS